MRSQRVEKRLDFSDDSGNTGVNGFFKVLISINSSKLDCLETEGKRRRASTHANRGFEPQAPACWLKPELCLREETFEVASHLLVGDKGRSSGKRQSPDEPRCDSVQALAFSSCEL